MTIVSGRTLAYGIALFGALGSARPMQAQLGVGTWVRKTPATPAMSMKVESCCGAGRRLDYYLAANGTKMLLRVESRFDGSDAPVLIDGKPSGETMAIKRTDDHHLATIIKMNGKPFGTSTATLSTDGKTLTVLNVYTSSAGGNPAGKLTEIWTLK